MEQIGEAFHTLMPADFDKEKLSIETEIVEGFENRKIQILTLEFSKEAQTNIFLKNLKELLGHDQYLTILDQKESRLDDELYFYIRLNSSELFEGNAILTDSGDCFHIRLTIAAFPKNRLSALKVVEEIFK
jgi:RNA binding exosome subunit